MEVEEVVKFLKETVKEGELLPVVLAIVKVESSFNPFAWPIREPPTRKVEF